MATRAGCSSQACAACKHQRRKCHSDCLLARYFPPERAREFLNVHRLFGVSNLVKFHNMVEPELRKKAVETLIYEAEARHLDPVYGSTGIIQNLNEQVEAIRQELEDVKRQIVMYQQFISMHQRTSPMVLPPQQVNAPVDVEMTKTGENGTKCKTSDNETMNQICQMPTNLAIDQQCNNNPLLAEIRRITEQLKSRETQTSDWA